MRLPILRNTGIPELESVLAEYAAAIGRLERLIGALQLTGGAAGSTVSRVVSPNGIPPAIDDDHPGVGNVMIRVMSGDGVLRDSGIVAPCYNIALGSLGGVATGKQIITTPLYNKPGFQAVVVDPCPPI